MRLVVSAGQESDHRAQNVLAELARLNTDGMMDGLVYVVNVRGQGHLYGMLGTYEREPFPAIAALRKLRGNLETLIDHREGLRVRAHHG